MIKPTLENPYIIIEVQSNAKDGNKTERDSSYIFVRAFRSEDGTRIYNFTSVTVKQDGKEVVISNQEKRPTKIASLIENGKRLWSRTDNATDSSDENQDLYNSRNNTSDSETEVHVMSRSASEGKSSNNSELKQENQQKNAEKNNEEVTDTKEERDKRLAEERKNRILKEGTSFDGTFGLIAPADIKTADDIISNVNKIVSGLKEREGKDMSNFDGFAYGNGYASNSGEQVREYILSLNCGHVQE